MDLSEENRLHHLNPHLHGLNKSATLEINEKSGKLEKQGKKVYRFGLGQSPFPIPEIVVQALRDNAHQKDYLPVKGLYQLREAVAAYHSKQINREISAEQVLIGPGSKELLFLAQLTFNGDLLVPNPCWVSYIPQAIIIGRTVRVIHTCFSDKWRLKANQLREICEQDVKDGNTKSKLLLLNYPGNPEGNTYSAEELQEIAEVAKEYNILILSDEIYAELDFDNNHVSIAKFYPEGTIISSGLSKWAAAGGWRLGTFTFPTELKWLLDAMAIVASETYSCVSAPIQYAAITAFKGDKTIDEYLEKARTLLAFLGNWIAKKVQTWKLEVHDPKGAFYLFIDFEFYRNKLNSLGITNSKQLADSLLNAAGVAILPGVDFSRPLHELTARLAYVNFDGKQAMDAMENEQLNEQFIEKYCSNTVEGIHKLGEWLENIRTN
ncbi:MAG: pyridoxal phosphate-dependent aminotransferase [Candidatus Heimdallarchaeota archaeon]|nr:pyridoxal phosphate-dependent aminotransferase [Candidatus Heimdallarchaeota archaeon]